MDERIEVAQWKLNTVDWAIKAMADPNYGPPDEKDMAALYVLISEINRDLDAAIQEASK